MSNWTAYPLDQSHEDDLRGVLDAVYELDSSFNPIIVNVLDVYYLVTTAEISQNVIDASTTTGLSTWYTSYTQRFGGNLGLALPGNWQIPSLIDIATGLIQTGPWQGLTETLLPRELYAERFDQVLVKKITKDGELTVELSGPGTYKSKLFQVKDTTISQDQINALLENVSFMNPWSAQYLSSNLKLSVVPRVLSPLITAETPEKK